jgi:two-component system phosphate regulon response regulator PhoB
LNSHDYEVGEAADGHEALDVFAARKPDLVVLDWHLPELSGIETCRALHNNSAVPIIMVSANRLNTKRTAIEAGAYDFLPKPFSLNDLLSRIESALRSVNS